MSIFQNHIFKLINLVLLFTVFSNNAHALIHHGGALSQDETWGADEVHYIDSIVTVNSGITLTIEPGSIIKFASSTYLQVNGVLNARGEEFSPIYFTSYRDDTLGGDDNGDGLSFAQAGDWSNIRFSDSIIDSLNYLEYVNIHFSGGQSGLGAIYLEHASPNLNFINITDSQYIGVDAYGSGTVVTLNNVNIERSGAQGIYADYSASLTINNSEITQSDSHGIYVYRSAKVLLDQTNIIDNGEWGIYFADNYPGSTITNTTVTGNDRGMYVPIDMLPNPEDQNTLLPNDQNAIWVRAGTRTSSLTLFNHSSQLAPNQTINTYYIAGDWAQNGGVLTFEPGVNVKFTSASSLTVNAATLLAQGVAGKPITFTSLYDDSIGGDLGRGDSPKSAKAGSWEGIRLNSTVTSDSVIEFVDIKYAGQSTNANLYVDTNDLSISNLRSQFAYGYGLYAYRSNLTVENSEFSFNTSQGFFQTSSGTSSLTNSKFLGNGHDGIYANSNTGVNVSQSYIYANGRHGINTHVTSLEVQAQDNWWGAPDGPSSLDGSFDGSGNSIAGNVSISSLLIDQYLEFGDAHRYANAGTDEQHGLLSSFVLSKGQVTQEFGASAWQTAWYDEQSIDLSTTNLDPLKQYVLVINAFNSDNNGNVQHAEDALGNRIIDEMVVGSSNAIFGGVIAQSSYLDGNLDISIILDSGHRAVVQQVWLLEFSDEFPMLPAADVDNVIDGQIFTGQEVVLTGQADFSTSVELVVYSVLNDQTSYFDVHSISSDGLFSYLWTLPEDGDYQLSVVAHNDNAMQNQSLPIDIKVDQTAPNSVSFFSVTDTPNDSGTSLTLNWVEAEDAIAQDSDVASYFIYRRDQAGQNWIQIQVVNAPAQSFVDDLVLSGFVYDYKIEVLDVAGNASEPFVQIAKTAIDNSIVDTLAPEDITDLTAHLGDQIIHLNWGLSLDTQGDLVNQIVDISIDDGVSFGTNAPDYNNGEFYTLNANQDQYSLDNLVNDIGYRVRIRTIDAQSNIGTGVISSALTPSQLAFTTIDSHISKDTHWKSGTYYISASINLNAGYSLTIDPGVIVKFASGRSLTVIGELNADGVTFTSFSDDLAGGDHNSDGLSAGDQIAWGYIHFPTNATGDSVIQNSTLRFGGSNTAIIYNRKSGTVIQNNRIEFSNTSGFYTRDGSGVVFSGNEVFDNATNGVYQYSGSTSYQDNHIARNQHGLNINSGGAPVIENNVIEDHSGWGIYNSSAISGEPIISNTIRNNQSAARLSFSNLPVSVSDNTIVDNDSQVIHFLGNARSYDLALSSDFVYRQLNSTATINAGSRMDIEAGTVLKFDAGSYLTINGALIAKGTELEPITFTSDRDDSVGGDTENNGLTYGTKGDWGRITFNDSSVDFASTLEYVNIRFGGTGSNGALYIENASPTLSHVTIQDSAVHGLYIYGVGSTSTLDHVVVENSDQIGLYARHSSNLTIVDSKFNNNGTYGVYSYQSAVLNIDRTQVKDNASWGVLFNDAVTGSSITNSEVTGNDRGLYIPITMVPSPEDQNILVPNAQNALWVRAGTRSTDLTLAQHNNIEAPGQIINSYYISGDWTQSGGVLTIEPGVNIKFTDSGSLVVNAATLIAQGTQQERITFTSIHDDSAGGDLGRNGDATIARAGIWDGLTFNSTMSSDSVFDYVDIKFGGNNGYGNIFVHTNNNLSFNNIRSTQSSKKGIYAHRSNVSVDQSVLALNNEQGFLQTSTGTSNITGSEIYANGHDGIYVNTGTGVSINDSQIYANGRYGINTHASSLEVQAQNNWWGAQDGPSQVDEGLVGQGERLNGNVNITSMLSNDFKTQGPKFRYIDAGGLEQRGTLSEFTILQGKTSEELGSDAWSDMWFDSTSIDLQATGLNELNSYKVIAQFQNNDSGTNLQHIEDANGLNISGKIQASAYSTIHGFDLPASSISSNELLLSIKPDSGLRSTVQQLWLIENLDAPLSQASASISNIQTQDLLTGTQVIINGDSTNSESVFIHVYDQNSQLVSKELVHSLNTNGEFSYRWILPADGVYFIAAQGVNAQNSNALDLIEVIVDQTPAIAVQYFSVVDTPQDLGESLSLSWQLSATESLQESDVQQYIINKRISGQIQWQLLTEVVPGADVFVDADVQLGVAYDYQIIVQDNAGNKSEANTSFNNESIDNTLEDTLAPEPVSGLVVEAGNARIDVQWTLSTNGQLDIVKQYLDISIDDDINFGTNAPTYDDAQVIEVNVNQNQITLTQLENDLAHRIRLRTVDVAGNISTAVISDIVTPSVGAYRVINSAISEDTHWKSGTYYVSSSFTINSNVTLTIDPGVIVKVGGSRTITVNGQLIADGVTFTSWSDDSVGGDTNNNGESLGSDAHWTNIYIPTNATGDSVIQNSTLRFGGSSTAIIYNRKSGTVIQNNRIEFSNTSGFYTRDGSGVVFSGNEVFDNATNGVYQYSGSTSYQDNHIARNQHGLNINSGDAPVIENNVIEDHSGWGIYNSSAISGEPITGNTIRNNQSAARLSFSNLPVSVSDNTIVDNDSQVIHFLGNARSYDLALSSDFVYRQLNSTATINAGSRMDIEAGTVLKFDAGSYLTINGALIAKGTELEPITFTSDRDDSVGGDTENNGLTYGTKGDWGRITFNDSSVDFASILEYVNIRFGGTGSNGALYIENASPTLSHVTIQDSAVHGLYIYGVGSTSTLDHVVVENSDQIGLYARHSSNLTIVDSKFNNNGTYGVYSYQSAVLNIDRTQVKDNASWGVLFNDAVTGSSITNSEVTGNDRGLYIPITMVPSPEDQNILVPNAQNALWVRAGTRSTDLTLAQHNNIEAPGQIINSYYISGDWTQNGGVLTIEPGVNVKFTDSGSLVVNAATLIAQGTQQERITFTSIHDDSAGGDLGRNGDATIARAGIWDGLTFNSTMSSDSVFDYVDIKFGGNNGYGNIFVHTNNNLSFNNIRSTQSSKTGIYAHRSNVSVDQSVLALNNEQGFLQTSTGTSNITGSEIYANGMDGIYVNSSTGVNVSDSEIFANGRHGINAHASSLEVQAQNNWWGAQDGPSGEFNGSGDSITTNVVFDTIQESGTEYAYYDAGGINHKQYGVLNPVVEGEQSLELGSNPLQSLLVDNDKNIEMLFSALDNNARYRLIVSYVNVSGEVSNQRLVTSTGFEIHPAQSISTVATSYEYLLPVSEVVDGNLVLNLEAVDGYRAKIAAIYLIKEVAPVLDVSVSITTLADSVVNNQGLTLTGLFSNESISLLNLYVEYPTGLIQKNTISDTNNEGQWAYQFNSSEQGVVDVWVQAIDLNGKISNTPRLALSADTISPAGISQLTIVQNNQGLLVQFLEPSDQSDVLNYVLSRRSNIADSFEIVASLDVGQIEYLDTDLVNGDYYYQVYAIDAAGNLSEVVNSDAITFDSALIDVTAPEVPASISASISNDSIKTLARVSWARVANAANDLAAYEVSVFVGENATFGTNAPLFNNSERFSVNPLANDIFISGLELGNDYRFEVNTIDGFGNRSDANFATATVDADSYQAINLSGTFTVDSYFPKAVYLLTGSVTVNSSVKLEFERGSIVKVANSSTISVSGQLVADGVIFTSIHDDEHGGDTNNNADATVPSSGLWNHIYISSATENSLTDTRILYSGRSTGALYLNGTTTVVDLDNIEINYSGTHGLYMQNARLSIENSTISNSVNDGIYQYSGNSSLSNNTIENNNHGYRIRSGSYGVINDNQFINNTGFGLLFDSGFAGAVPQRNTIEGNGYAYRLSFSTLPTSADGNIVRNNTHQRFEYYGNSRQSDFTFEYFENEYAGVYYHLGTTDATNSAGFVITAEPGVVVKMDSAGLVIDGALVAQGRSDAPIIFTALEDDEVVGDTNNDGAASSAVNGTWKGLYFNNSAIENLSILDFVQIHYAGNTSYYGALYLNNADITVYNSEIHGSSSHGIRIYDSSPIIEGNRIWGNIGAGVYSERSLSNPSIAFNRISTNGGSGIDILAGLPTNVSNNQVFLNDDYGLLNRTSNVLDASQSWWGDVDGSGPFHATDYPLGTGERVSDNVNATPFLTQAPFELGYSNFNENGLEHVGDIAAPVIVQGVMSNEWSAAQDPGKTMIWHDERIILDYAGLDPQKQYKVRVTYYAGDGISTRQSLIDGTESVIHQSQLMPTASASQYQYSIAKALYADGNLQLQFVNDNSDTSIRAQVSQVWIFEDLGELSPPRFETVGYNDLDGDSIYSVGDTLSFVFSDPINAQLLTDSATNNDANEHFVNGEGFGFGLNAAVEISADEKTVIVTLAEGFTLQPTHIVSVSGIQDQESNYAVGAQSLPTSDNIAPFLQSINWIDVDSSLSISLGDQYEFVFSEAMVTSSLIDNSTNANALLRPQGGLKYGDINTISWNAQENAVTVTITEGYNLIGDELIIPSKFITDKAANNITGSDYLKGKDQISPELIDVIFEDADGSNDVSIGDFYRFVFNEAMDESGLTNLSAEANVNLSPAGASFGEINSVIWSQDSTYVDVSVSAGFSIVGNELIEPGVSISDINENNLLNTAALTLSLEDRIAPVLTQVTPNAASPVLIDSMYQLSIQFSSSMLDSAPQFVVEGVSQVPVITTGQWITTRFTNDTFVTDAIALTDEMVGSLSLNIAQAQDLDGNEFVAVDDAFVFFIAKPAPNVVSHQLSPIVNKLTERTVTLSGTRDYSSSIVVDSNEVAEFASGVWVAQITLQEGVNQIELWANDEFGLPSSSVDFIFDVDSIQPVVQSVVPSHNSLVNSDTNEVVVNFVETGSGIDFDGSTFVVNDITHNTEVVGQWSLAATSLIFTSQTNLDDANYEVVVQLLDKAGLTSNVSSTGFTLDQTAPEPLQLDLPIVTTSNPLLISGDKEILAEIWLNGSRIVSATNSDQWSYELNLAQGQNTLSFRSKDRAGNLSLPYVHYLRFDNTAPGQVAITIDPNGDGHQLNVDWSDYDESANGNDIAFYRAYVSDQNFTDITQAGVTRVAQVSGNQKQVTINDLAAAQDSYVAIVAVDALGLFANQVVATPSTPVDGQAPLEVVEPLIFPSALSINLRWRLENDADRAAINVYVDDVLEHELSADAIEAELVNLELASLYHVRITTLDALGNESKGVQFDASTLLSNPQDVSVTPYNQRVELIWNAIEPDSIVSKYLIYQSDTEILDVTSMSPVLVMIKAQTSAWVTGLTNDQTYHFAVTVVNQSGGENKQVQSVSATPVVIDPPMFTSITYNDVDGSQSASVSDQYHFTFSEPMITSAIQNGANHANSQLYAGLNKRYGQQNNVVWNEAGDALTITLTQGLNLTGLETIVGGNQLTDLTFNTLSNTIDLTLTDTIAPEIRIVQTNYISPVSAVDGYNVTIIFDSSMNTSVTPTVTLNSQDSTDVEFELGQWLTTVYPNDTYTTSSISLTNEHQGVFNIEVSGASDVAGNVMTLNSAAFVGEVDALAPANPEVSLNQQSCSQAQLTISAQNTSDVAGWQVYIKPEGELNIDGQSFDHLLNPNQMSFVLNNLELDQTYDVAVIAMDFVGNVDTNVVPSKIIIDQPVPASVNVQLSMGERTDQVSIAWDDYQPLCGTNEVAIYQSDGFIENVSGLTPVAVVSMDSEQYALISDLNRLQTQHFAVVANNAKGEQSEITAYAWADPLSNISNVEAVEISIGGENESTIDIYSDLIISDDKVLGVLAGTELIFHNGASLIVRDGKLELAGTVFDPIVMTASDTSQPWGGIQVESNSDMDASFVNIQYAQTGLALESTTLFSAINLEAISITHAQNSAISLNGSSQLTANSLFIAYNALGLNVVDAAQINLNHSVIKNNEQSIIHTTSAFSNLDDNWWGMADIDEVNILLPDFAVSSVLSSELVLHPAFQILNGELNVIDRMVTLEMAALNADEMRVSENSQFLNSFFVEYSKQTQIKISENGGEKSLYAQFRSITGEVSPTLELTFQYITDGPVISNVSIEQNTSISRPELISANSTAILGVSTIALHVDGAVWEEQAAEDLSVWFDPRSLNNGIHELKVVAIDRAGHISEVARNVVIGLDAPSAPVLTTPINNLVTVEDVVNISGYAEAFMNVKVRLNGAVVGDITTDEMGLFSLTDISINEGESSILATAVDTVGVSSQSNEIVVIKDTSVPEAVTIRAQALFKGEGIQISWDEANTGETPVQIALYRSESEFTSVDQAQLILVTSDSDIIDQPDIDGIYYYAALGLDSAGNESLISNVVAQNFDKTPPVISVTFDKNSPVAQGVLNVTLTSSEPLRNTPSLTITPNGFNGPIAVILSKISETLYQGEMMVTQSYSNGLAHVKTSAIDQNANAFNGEPDGVSLYFDTKGPSASISTDIPSPVQTTSDVDLVVSIELDEIPAQLPELSAIYPSGERVDLVLTGTDTSYTSQITASSSFGDGDLKFVFEAIDGYGNTSTEILSGGIIELYSGDTPTAALPPINVEATAVVNGRVELEWDQSELAQSYQIYRANGLCSTVPVDLIDEVADLNYVDTPVVDGAYCYGVKSYRSGALSSFSRILGVISDREAPNLVDGLSVALDIEGIKVQWNDPATNVAQTYELLRNGQSIRELTAGNGQYIINDQPSIGGSYVYQVKGVDQAGNESISGQLNLDLLVGAVSNLTAYVANGQAPELTWENNDASVVGYLIYKGDQQMTANPITQTQWIDERYAGSSSVAYQVVAVNAQSEHSPAREIIVNPIAMSAVANVNQDGVEQPFITNYFNEVLLTIENGSNNSAVSIDDLHVQLSVDNVDQFVRDLSINVEIASSSTAQQQIVLPINNELSTHLLVVDAIDEDQSGNKVIYKQAFLFDDIQVPDQMLSVGLNDVPLAGSTTTVQACITNHSFVSAYFIASKKNGEDPGELWVQINDENGFELARGTYSGIPNGSFIQSNGDAQVHLGANETICIDMNVLVPAGIESGSSIEFVATIEQLHFNDYIVGMDGAITGSTLSGITQTPYYAIANVEHDFYSDNETVLITGQAFNRIDDSFAANVDVKIGFNVRGYKWYEEVVVNEIGEFEFEYVPSLGLGGQFDVWASHPDVVDQLNQAQFSYMRLYANPSFGNIRSSKADSLDIDIKLINASSELITQIALDFSAYTLDSEGAEVPEYRVSGELESGNNILLAPDGEVNVTVNLTAQLDAPEELYVRYRILTEQGATVTFEAKVTLSDAVPIMKVVSPKAGYIDVSMNRGEQRIVPLILENTGLRTLENAFVTLPENVTWMGVTQEKNNGVVQLGDVAVGQSVSIDVMLTPPTDADFGYHEDVYQFNGSNAIAPLDTYVYTLLTSAVNGSVQFDVFNILGLQVENATVRLRNTVVQQDLGPFTTDFDGKVIIEDINIGQWTYQVSAPGHSTASGVIDIQADQVILESVELDKSLVTVTFNVVPVPYTDRYEIVIEQKFETHVPVPVLVVDPIHTEFNNPTPGLEVVVPINVSNYGLKNLTDLTIEGQTTAWGSWEPLIDYMPVLGAMETVEIPFKFRYYGPVGGILPAAPDFECGSIQTSASISLDDVVNGLSAFLFAAYRSINENLPRTAGSNTGIKLNFSICGGVGIGAEGTDQTIDLGGGVKCPGKLGDMLEKVKDYIPAVHCKTSPTDAQSTQTQSTQYGTGYGAGGTGCFVPGTPILMADGTSKAIEDIQLRDQVQGFDGSGASVMKVYERQTDHLRELRYQNSQTGELLRVETTDEHHYWVQNKKAWILAGDLEIGDTFALSEGQFGQLMESSRREVNTIVYNFDVENLQSYYANGALVYQQCGAKTDDSVTELLLNTQEQKWQQSSIFQIKPKAILNLEKETQQ
ncbi:right-handed parallel beta-helix repeat-containing protein [Marinicellulosiphila megalodicopiae]|uniref:right-handed parallel beta-helix repeat-containing protein n=1 Tax=Marinicellulosiphila megalodicopiae TaxID=2724896 RepID=UPI003BB1610F